jgi:hypothetical protein
MIRGEKQQAEFEQFEAEHGPIVWRKHMGYTKDGYELEDTSLGVWYRCSNTPEQIHDRTILFWKYRLEDLTQEIDNLKAKLESQSQRWALTPEDVAGLKELQSAVQEAAKQFDLLENPPGPDVKAVRKAIKLFNERERLAADCKAAEDAYENGMDEAHGIPTPRTDRLADAWEAAYDKWDKANQAYQKIDQLVRREAESQIIDDRAEERRRRDAKLLDDIEI